jgi:hypothetical protein
MKACKRLRETSAFITDPPESVYFPLVRCKDDYHRFARSNLRSTADVLRSSDSVQERKFWVYAWGIDVSRTSPRTGTGRRDVASVVFMGGRHNVRRDECSG